MTIINHDLNRDSQRESKLRNVFFSKGLWSRRAQKCSYRLAASLKRNFLNMADQANGAEETIIAFDEPHFT